jgi:hypothetical protein
MKSLFAFIIGVFLFVACNDGTNTENVSKPAETALPASGVGDNNFFKATGEVVVIFEPSPSRAKTLEESKDSTYLINKRRFNAEARLLQNKITSMGRQAYLSQEDDINIIVSQNQAYLLNAGVVKGGYGVVMAKLNAQPKLIVGIPTMEELEKEMNAYYGPSK